MFGIDPKTGLPKALSEQLELQKAYGQSFQQAIGMVQPPAYSGARSMQGAEGQMWEGLQQQQEQAQAQASRRGFSPLAARAATQAGAEMQSAGLGMAQQLRAQEEAARRAALLDLYRQRSQFDVQGMGLQSERMQQDLNKRMAEAAMQAQMEAQQRQEEAGIIGGVLQAAGAIGQAVVSDRRMKRGIRPAGRDLDAMMGTLGSYGKK
jgi:hypothetical protein